MNVVILASHLYSHYCLLASLLVRSLVYDVLHAIDDPNIASWLLQRIEYVMKRPAASQELAIASWLLLYEWDRAVDVPILAIASWLLPSTSRQHQKCVP